MATKSVIEIDLQGAEAFEKFSALYKKFEGMLKQAPDAWKKVGAEISGATTKLDDTVEGVEAAGAAVDETTAKVEGLGQAVDGAAEKIKNVQGAAAGVDKSMGGVRETSTRVGLTFDQMVRALLVQSTLSRQIADDQRKADKDARDAGRVARDKDRVTQNSARSWRDMARSTRSVASHVKDATMQLLRWASITGVISGLLGAGGLFGISRLAQSAAGQRRSAQGLGVSPGEQNAFRVNYGRIVDPDSFLGSVADSLTDATKRTALRGAGLSESDIQGKSTAQVGVRLLEEIKKIADQTPREIMEQVLNARGLNQFIDLDTFRRLQALPPGELGTIAGRFGQDQGRMDLTQGQQLAWQNLHVQLQRAADIIEKSFITALSPLAPKIEELSKSFTGMVETLLKSKTIEGWIDSLGRGLRSLDETLSKPGFQADMEAFVKRVGEVVAGLGRMAAWLASWFPEAAPPGTAGTDPARSGSAFSPEMAETIEKAQQARDERARQDALKNATPDNPTGLSWWQRNAPRILGGVPHADPWALPGTPGSALPGPRSGGGGSVPNGRTPIAPAPVPSNRPVQQSSQLETDRTTAAWDFFISKGWSPAQTAGILANIKNESDFEPTRVNQVGGDQGLAQWRGGRVKTYIAQYGHEPQKGSFQEQLEFIQWELSHPSGGEMNAGNTLRKLGTSYEAGAQVARDYERPDPNRIGIIMDQRGRLGQRYEYQFRDRRPLAPTSSGTPTSSLHPSDLGLSMAAMIDSYKARAMGGPTAAPALQMAAMPMNNGRSGQAVNINIYNNTGGNAIVSASQIAT